MDEKSGHTGNFEIIDLSDDGPSSRRAAWTMALGMHELAEIAPADARELPARGASSWLGALANRHVSGEVGTGDLIDAIELHYLDESDDARLTERRIDLLVARIVVVLLASSGKPVVRTLQNIRAALTDDGAARFRTHDIHQPEQILGGRAVSYVPASIVEDVVSHELSSFVQVTSSSGLQGQRSLGIALVKLLAGLWRARPFGEGDALVLAVFLLQVLAGSGVLVNPEPFALHASYFRLALVRSCFSSVDPCIGESLRFLELFCSNLFADGAHELVDSDTECHELQEKSFQSSQVVHTGDRGSYVLRVHDTPIAQLHFDRHRLGDVIISGLGASERYAHLMPLNLIARCDQRELERFVKSRVLARGRAHRGDILGAYGISGARTWAIIHFSHGACAMDAYSIVHESFDEPFDSYCLFGNDLDPTLQRIALNGGLLRSMVKRHGVPGELTGGGKAPKAWREQPDGGLMLYKTAVSPSSHAPASEHLASLIAQAIGAGGVSYGMDEWHGKVCSTGRAFTSSAVSFVPFGLCLHRDDLGEATLASALAFYDSVGPQAGEAFRTIAVLDYLLANPARGIDDHGVIRDAHSGELLGTAPAFDFDGALFSDDEDLPDADALVARAMRLVGMFRTPLVDQAIAAFGPQQQAMVERAAALDAADLVLSQIEEFDHAMLARVDALLAFVRKRAHALLEDVL